jgi:hypothetical protein
MERNMVTPNRVVNLDLYADRTSEQLKAYAALKPEEKERVDLAIKLLSEFDKNAHLIEAIPNGIVRRDFDISEARSALVAMALSGAIGAPKNDGGIK